MKLQGKTIVITGASSGIGEQLALQAAAEGAVPILMARSEGKLQALQENIQRAYGVPSRYYVLDVSDEEMVRQVFGRLLQDVEAVDVLINNAGFGIFKTFEEASLQDVKNMFAVNVFGLVACTQAVLPHMKRRGKGHIINIASLAGKIATPKSSAYSATKHAVLGFTNSLRMELDGTGIRVTAVNPGPIETGFFDIADESGTYVQNVKGFMLRADAVAARILRAIGTNKRELHLPRWMGLGPVIFSLFPRLFEGVAGKALNKK
ncbi:SDR family NAD(P)-dependent oxidoreductase [Ectobacillus ponti]|uniref:SDR family oxidoreductase n=1 Tax=Ectobacillus ponti TaxID=2961894 RepID=A0AA41X1G0_9BACI|nr:SDR family oxidoreductase [Ectobacillus ponti]MCP8966997.1 SDR family oxidoreductase [Ectobacillus ponti]